jgi:hypothetical protein
MRTDFELARLASLDQCRFSSNTATAMPRRELDLPPEVAKAFVRDMRAFHAEKSPLKRDEIAIRQLVVLNEYLGRREPLRVIDVKEMFVQMRDDE